MDMIVKGFPLWLTLAMLFDKAQAQPGLFMNIAMCGGGGSAGPDSAPTAGPTASMRPTSEPSAQPIGTPSVEPSANPTSAPSAPPIGVPSAEPSALPSPLPSTPPSPAPSSAPSAQPIGTPSVEPSATPSLRPSRAPSATPSQQPSAPPSRHPSLVPSAQPTDSAEPSTKPSLGPSAVPSLVPSEEPSPAPNACPEYTSAFDEVVWETGCPDYDFYGTLYFCRDQEFFGYRLNEDDACNTGLSPLIRMQAGKSYQLRLINKNGNNEPTNIHTHGLHIPGSGNTDDITRVVHSNYALFYNWTIPEVHMDGTFWYHSHVHERTNPQVNGGAVSMLIVEPSDTAATRADWVENTDNDRYLLLASVTTGRGRDAVTTDYANGDASGHTIPLYKNQWHRLRIAVADSEAEVRDITFDNAVCTAHLAAQDGVWRNVVPKAAQSTISLSGANRIDVAIRCSASSGLWYRTTSTSGTPLVSFDVCDAGSEDAATLAPWTPDRPLYLSSLTSASVDETFLIDEIDAQRGINGVPWDANVPLARLTHDTIQEWTIHDTRPHPFHLHLYHMQIVSPGGCGNLYDYGEWFDSISAATNAPCVVRFHTEGIGGRTVMHCHILRHEDAGVMGWVAVDNAPPNGGDHIEQTLSWDSECYAV